MRRSVSWVRQIAPDSARVYDTLGREGQSKRTSIHYRIHLLTTRKYMYGVTMLSLCANAVSKAAILFFHLRITPLRPQRAACYAMVGVCAVWMVVVVALIATRCGNSHPWMLHGRHCYNYVGIVASSQVGSVADGAIRALAGLVLQSPTQSWS